MRKGGDFIGFKPASTNGTFVFTIEQRHGKRMQWVAARAEAGTTCCSRSTRRPSTARRWSTGRKPS